MFTGVQQSILSILQDKEPSDRLTKDRAIAVALELSTKEIREELEQLQLEQVVQIRQLLGTYYARLTDKGRSEIEASP